MLRVMAVSDSFKIDPAELIDACAARYGRPKETVRLVRAPYRICPLGAHIDHQLGTVTAMAINHGVYLAYVPAGSAQVKLSSLNFSHEVTFDLNSIPAKAPGDWGNYVRGAALALGAKARLGQGILGVTAGNLAEGGLSSSAAIGVAYLLAFEEVNRLKLSSFDNVTLDQQIENNYLGLKNGILDQAAILFAQKHNLTTIDCKRFQVEAESAIKNIVAPAGLNFSIMVALSGVTEPIVNTAYNQRVGECREAARILIEKSKTEGGRELLGEITQAEFELHKNALPAPLLKRAFHFFSETSRVAAGIKAWAAGDLAQLGRLMTESGMSSIRNYECGSPPLIDLFQTLVETPGVYGARFSGAGFRGCCIALADPAKADEIVQGVEANYRRARPEFAAKARVLCCSSADGAEIVQPYPAGEAL